MSRDLQEEVVSMDLYSRHVGHGQMLQKVLSPFPHRPHGLAGEKTSEQSISV